MLGSADPIPQLLASVQAGGGFRQRSGGQEDLWELLLYEI